MKSSSDYYKEATQLKKQEKYDEAIKCIRKGIEIDNKNNMLGLIDTYLRIPMYYSYANKIDEAFKEIETIERQSELLCDLSKIYDAKRKIFQNIRDYKQAIINGIKSYLYEYSHCFSDFFTGVSQNKMFLKEGVIDQDTFDERYKKSKDFGQRCADNYSSDESLKRLIKNISKGSNIDNKITDSLSKYIQEKLSQKDNIDFKIIEMEMEKLL